MKEVKVIVGANFGDEGKGLMTDYICSKTKNPIVIRFNSGSQAGHTVVTKEGFRHVFGHFGSGSFNNIPTFLSKYFIVNPLTFLKEFNELRNMNIYPNVYIDEECLVTTPYDMIINQIVEIFRGSNNHGSCGLGFNETLVRNSNANFNIKVKDLLKCNNDITTLYKTLENIKNEYVYKRLNELGVTKIDDKFQEILDSDNVIMNFIEDIKEFIRYFKVSTFKELNCRFDTLVFEGAQGLMLHENYKYFPYVTHSKTGIENVIELLNEEYEKNSNRKIENVDIEVIYITRSYLTRHGAGPLPGEMKNKPYDKIIDLTNIPNRFQGSLRFALLDLDLLKNNIDSDFGKAKNCIYNIKKSLAITCIDQIDVCAKYIINGSDKESNILDFIDDIVSKIKPYKYYISSGETRDTVKEFAEGE